MIEITDKIVAIWYLQTLPTQDWMAAVSEIEPDSKYELVYRFRYYKDDKAFDSEDKKNWYSGTLTGTRSYVLAAMREVAGTMESVAKGKLYELVNEDGDVSKLMRKFQDLPFVYMRASNGTN